MRGYSRGDINVLKCNWIGGDNQMVNIALWSSSTYRQISFWRMLYAHLWEQLPWWDTFLCCWSYCVVCGVVCVCVCGVVGGCKNRAH